MKRSFVLTLPLFALATPLALGEVDAASLSLAAADYQPSNEAIEPVETPVYGAEDGGWWWTVGGGGGWSLNNGDGSAAAIVGASTFIAPDFEFSIDLTAWYYGDSAGDAVAANVNPRFRWHFVHEPTHTLFVEAGVGLLIAHDETPAGGSEFNYTPHAGVGATFSIEDGPSRLIVGLNWRHVSNADTFGSDRNPGRDDVFLYAGVTFPF